MVGFLSKNEEIKELVKHWTSDEKDSNAKDIA